MLAAWPSPLLAPGAPALPPPPQDELRTAQEDLSDLSSQVKELMGVLNGRSNEHHDSHHHHNHDPRSGSQELHCAGGKKGDSWYSW